MALVTVCVGSASASTITVTSTGDSGTGSLRAAITEAASGSTIVLPSSASAFAVTSGALDIDKNLTITGGGASSTVLNALKGHHRVFDVESGTVTISGVTVTGGNEGGVIAEGGSLTLSSDVVSQNGEEGGDGGIENRSGATLIIEGSTIEDNLGYNGGGLNLGGTTTIANTTIADNHAGGDAGGLQSSASLTLIDDAITGNQAKLNDGGMFVTGTTSITNTTIADNHAVGDAGGLAVNGKGLTLLNDTIADNESENGSRSGGGIDGGATATNTIVAENTDNKGEIDNCTEPLTAAGPNLENGSECAFAGHDGGIGEANPELAALANNGGPTETMALEPGSPAIDHATNTGCPTTDQRGGARPQPSGGTCDIGAFELGALDDLSVSQAATPTQITLGEVLTYTITVSNGGPGPDPSYGTTLQDTLPGGATLLSATPAQGGCSGSAPVSCALGTLAHGASTEVTIAVRPGVAGSTANRASVSSDATDANLTNNTSQLTSTVLAVALPSPTPTPVIGGLSQTEKVWREGNAPAHLSSATKRPPVGTTFMFTLNEAASVTLTFTKPASGRKVGRTCVALTRRNAHRKRCTRTVTAGALRFSGHAGANKVRFDGIIAKGRKLGPGNYRLLVVATLAGKRSATSTLHFTVLAP